MRARNRDCPVLRPTPPRVCHFFSPHLRTWFMHVSLFRSPPKIYFGFMKICRWPGEKFPVRDLSCVLWRRDVVIFGSSRVCRIGVQDIILSELVNRTKCACGLREGRGYMTCVLVRLHMIAFPTCLSIFRRIKMLLLHHDRCIVLLSFIMIL